MRYNEFDTVEGMILDTPKPPRSEERIALSRGGASVCQCYHSRCRR